MNQDLLSIGERIRNERKRQNLSQEALAEMIDCDRKALSPIENGSDGMRVLPVLKISKALDIPLSDIFPGEYFSDEADLLSEMAEIINLMKNIPQEKAYSALEGFKLMLKAMI